MNGRWTIRVDVDGNVSGRQPGRWSTLSTIIPVVPCDDAAVERAERAVLALPEWDRSDPRQIAAAVLGAAGETPQTEGLMT